MTIKINSKVRKNLILQIEIELGEPSVENTMYIHDDCLKIVRQCEETPEGRKRPYSYEMEELCRTMYKKIEEQISGVKDENKM